MTRRVPYPPSSEYPKIETLFDRDKDTFTVTNHFRQPEFSLISRWHVTEKVDGTNIRVTYSPQIDGVEYDDRYINEDGAVSSRGIKVASIAARVDFNGRTDKAQMQPNVKELLDFLFPSVEPFVDMFSDSHVVIYGEAYGPGVQKSGGNYRRSVGFRVFDVCIGGIFLNWKNVEDIASELGCSTVPVLNPAATLEEAIALVPGNSEVAAFENSAAWEQEGIVARTEPGLLSRNNRRVIWKLKNSDYRAGKR